MKNVLSTLIGSSVLAAGLAAGSSVVAPIASAFTLDFNAYYGSTNNPATGASAEVDFVFTDVGNDVKLEMNITNNTGDVLSDYFGNSITTSSATESRFMGFGLDYTKGNLVDIFNITSSDYTGNSKFGNLIFDDNSISGQAGVTDGNSEMERNFNNIIFDIGFGNKSTLMGNGSPNGALGAGESTIVSLILDSDMNAAATELWFDNAFKNNEFNSGARFKAVNAGAGSDKILGGIYEEFISEPKVRVPEPSSIVALTFIGGGMLLSRRRSH